MTHACNPLSEDRYANVVDILCHHVTQTPQRLALGYQRSLDDELQAIDYVTLDRQARAIAVRLQQVSATGRPVLLLYPPGLDFVYAFLGCLYAGAIAVPSYVPQRPRSVRRLEAIARETDVSCILTTSGLLAELYEKVRGIDSLARACWLSTDSLPPVPAAAVFFHSAAVDEVACLQFTSGSTANPKGVMLTHGNLITNSRIIQRAFQHHAGSTGVIWLPPYHDMGLIGGILQPLLVGFPTILMPPVETIQHPLRVVASDHHLSCHDQWRSQFRFRTLFEHPGSRIGTVGSVVLAGRLQWCRTGATGDDGRLRRQVCAMWFLAECLLAMLRFGRSHVVRVRQPFAAQPAIRHCAGPGPGIGRDARTLLRLFRSRGRAVAGGRGRPRSLLSRCGRGAGRNLDCRQQQCSGILESSLRDGCDLSRDFDQRR